MTDRSLIDKLQQMLSESWGRVCGGAEGAVGYWSRFNPAERPANDPEFTQPPSSRQCSAKNDAKGPEMRPFPTVSCQKVFAPHTAGNPHDYWVFTFVTSSVAGDK